MNIYDIKRLGLILAIQSEIEGMKAENSQRKLLGHSMVYTQYDFNERSEELRSIVYKHAEEL